MVVGELVKGGYSLPRKKYIIPKTIVDGGANIGVFAIQAAAMFPNIPVKCYEPDVTNQECLKANLELNGINALIIPKAMWPCEGKLFFHPGMSYSGHVSSELSPYPIDCELPILPPDCWLKLDIEGSEYEVLPALLAGQNKPCIISMEIHDAPTRGQNLINLLNESGYQIEGSLLPDEHCLNICAYRIA